MTVENFVPIVWTIFEKIEKKLKIDCFFAIFRFLAFCVVYHAMSCKLLFLGQFLHLYVLPEPETVSEIILYSVNKITHIANSSMIIL